MGEFLEIIERLECLSAPVVLATLLKVNDDSGQVRAGARRILESAPGEGLEEAAEGVLVSGRPLVITGEPGGWPGAAAILLERVVPGRLPPWMHLGAQAARRAGTCVLATVGVVEGPVPYAVGDRFVYDERNHGLLPMDGRFSLDLQRGCQKVREAGQPRWQRFDLQGGSLGVCLEPLAFAGQP